MWERDEDRLALFELLQCGHLRRRQAQSEVWTLLAELPWTRRTARRDEIELRPECRGTVVELLDRVWPDWTEAREALADRGLGCAPADWRRLRDLLRAEGVGDLPDRLNRRTAASAVGPHSKAALAAVRRAALAATALTRDGIVRLRPPAGLRVVRGDSAIDARVAAAVLGEVTVTERALLDGTRLEGTVRALLLVENLGPYQDLDPPAGWLVAHVPGWDTATLRSFLPLLPDIPIVHFGDLDPAGVRIVRHLRQMSPRLRWAVPDFWADYIDTRAIPGEWPEDLTLDGTPELVHQLAARGVWLEQEAIAIDTRLRPALETLVDPRSER